MIRHLIALMSLPFCLSLPVQAADEVPPATAYREIMEAQFSARAKPLPLRPDEAQRVYENYLQSMGKPARDLSTNSGGNDPSPSR